MVLQTSIVERDLFLIMSPLKLRSKPLLASLIPAAERSEGNSPAFKKDQGSQAGDRLQN